MRGGGINARNKKDVRKRESERGIEESNKRGWRNRSWRKVGRERTEREREGLR